jgi:uncharacterized protein (TIGR01777 family)
MNIRRESTVLAPAQFVYDWHTRDGAFERLMPPWESVELLESDGGFENREVVVKMKRFGVPIRWVAKHVEAVPGQRFVDEQLSGPFKRWRHSHVFESLGNNRTKMIDDISCALPLSVLSHGVAGGQVKRDVSAMLAYRHAIVGHDLALLAQYPLPPQVIGITGASGLIGRALVPFLTAAGHKVRHLVRKKRPDWRHECCWDPEVGILDDFSDMTMLIHLAGESIAAPIRWSQKKKNRLVRSRVRATQALVQQLETTPHQIHTFICASAIGIYPDSTQAMTESSASGEGFLSTLVRDWEAMCNPIRDKVRVCNARFGVVLHPNGGMLKRLLPLMRAGMLGRIGDGQQFLSWVALDDAIRAIYMMMANASLSGPVNVVSPTPQLQLAWVKEWAKASFRPAMVPLPEPVVRGVMGEMGHELLLKSQHVVPSVLNGINFEFQCPTMTDVCGLYGL